MIRRIIIGACLCVAIVILAGGVLSFEESWDWELGRSEPAQPDHSDTSRGWKLRLSCDYGFAGAWLTLPTGDAPPGTTPSSGWSRDYIWISWGWHQTYRYWMTDTYEFTTFLGWPWIVLMAYPTVVLGRWLRRGRRRWERGACQCCGYDLQGNVTGVCSECGAEAPKGLGLPRVIRVRLLLLAGCCVAMVVVLTASLVSVVRPLTLREDGLLAWPGDAFEPEGLQFEGDKAPRMRYRIIDGWLTIERRSVLFEPLGESISETQVRLVGSGHPETSSRPSAGSSYSERYVHRTSRELPGVLSYHTASETEWFRSTMVAGLSLWAVAVVFGLWPVLELLRRMRKRRAERASGSDTAARSVG